MRKFAFITGSRAEWGLLRPIIKALPSKVDFKVMVTGSHLSESYGMTVNEIIKEDFPVELVDIALSGDGKLEKCAAMGVCMVGMSDALSRYKPDLAVILGDRYEILATACACTMLGIPIAHIHGGESTEGAIDDQMRHAITKLSYWHFASHEDYAKRIRQMGENSERIFVSGAPGIDGMKREFASKEEVEEQLGIELNDALLITYHPETLCKMTPAKQVNELLVALNGFRGRSLIITGANADCGGQEINDILKEYCMGTNNAIFRMSLGQKLYFDTMYHSKVVVGNSSSGVIEAPVMGRMTVNIGDRQKGRIRAPSVIDCGCRVGDIVDSIGDALLMGDQKPFKGFGQPGEISPWIARKLLEMSIPDLLRKPFVDNTE